MPGEYGLWTLSLQSQIRRVVDINPCQPASAGNLCKTKCTILHESVGCLAKLILWIHG